MARLLVGILPLHSGKRCTEQAQFTAHRERKSWLGESGSPITLFIGGRYADLSHCYFLISPRTPNLPSWRGVLGWHRPKESPESA
jgi:hypothetical protein